VRSRLDLMQSVWGYSSAVITRTVDTHMFELRRKLEADAARPRHIMTVRGIGYRLDIRDRQLHFPIQSFLPWRLGERYLFSSSSPQSTFQRRGAHSTT
jgi:hypothetical protein